MRKTLVIAFGLIILMVAAVAWAEPVLSVSPTSLNVPYASSVYSKINISNTGTGTMLWTATVISGTSWLILHPFYPSHGTNSGTIYCSAQRNPKTSSRTGIIRITATGATGSPVDVTVTQEANPSPVPVLSISPTSLNVPYVYDLASKINISNTGTGTMPWTATVISGTSWVRLSKDSWGFGLSSSLSGTDSGTIYCFVQPNTSTSARTATIRITATGATGSPKDVTVTQEAKPSPILSVSPTTRNEAKDIGTTSFSISNTGTGTMPWTAAVTSGGSWLKIISGSSGSNVGTINCSFTANTSTSARTATIRVIATGATGSPKDVTVTQAGTSTQTTNKILGVWSDGVYSWNQSTKKWTKIPSTDNALMIAAGKIDSDSTDDLVGVWPSGLYVLQSTNGQWVKLSTSLPTWIIAGDLNNDGRNDVIGSWKGDGVYWRDSATGKWTRISTPAKQLAVGNMHGDGRDDLVGVWDSGLWLRISTTGAWQKIDPAIPLWITAGDMTGSDRSDIIGSYTSGTWYRNSASKAWTKIVMPAEITTPAEQLTTGDIDGDGRDDLIGVWSNAVWVRYGATGQWQQISSSKPKWITTGRVAEAVLSADSLDDPMESSEETVVVDLSQEGPGGAAFDMSFFDEDGPAPMDGDIQ